MDIVDIQHEIEALPAEQESALLDWLTERDRLRWDAEIEQDFSPGGRGAALLDRVKQQVRDSQTTPWSKGRQRE
jgi:hypothetical protein